MHLRGKDLPQIICIAKVGKDNKLQVKSAVFKYLNQQPEEKLYLKFENEFLINTKEITGVEIPLINNIFIILPESVLKHLELELNSYICFIQRPNAVAIKKFIVEEKRAGAPNLYDQEGQYVNNRIIETFPNPEILLEKLQTKYRDFKLKYDHLKVWLYDETYTGWKARAILDISRDDEEDIRNSLIQEKLAEQNPNGSWGDNIIVTARILKELADFGMNRNYPQIAKAITWLLTKTESEYNPGMFFITDEALKEQLEVITIREDKTKEAKPRFRKFVSTERKIMEQADELYDNPCGPRLLWPNAFVLETLLAYGYETHERIQRMMQTLLLGHSWCECGFQHGISGFRSLEPKTIDDIAKFEKQTKTEFLLGGIKSTKYLYSKTSIRRQKRFEEISSNEISVYPIDVQHEIQGCEMITTQALNQVKDELMKRYAEAHLWRYATILNNINDDPILMKHNKKYSVSPFTLLKLFGSYNTLPARIGTLISIPWIIQNQNDDGTWGKDNQRNNATIAVLSALKKTNLI
ncbi:MAG: hypothetical protein ACTSSK_00545 [Candidatus Heimdallarchaeota archaeon]